MNDNAEQKRWCMLIVTAHCWAAKWSHNSVSCHVASCRAGLILIHHFLLSLLIFHNHHSLPVPIPPLPYRGFLTLPFSPLFSLQPSQLRCVFSSDFLGDLENYTFLKTRWYKQSENQCFHLHRYPHGGHLGFFKMAAGKCIFVHFSASKCHLALMLTPKTTFSAARSPMVPK